MRLSTFHIYNLQKQSCNLLNYDHKWLEYEDNQEKKNHNYDKYITIYLLEIVVLSPKSSPLLQRENPSGSWSEVIEDSRQFAKVGFPEESWAAVTTRRLADVVRVVIVVVAVRNIK